MLHEANNRRKSCWLKLPETGGSQKCMRGQAHLQIARIHNAEIALQIPSRLQQEQVEHEAILAALEARHAEEAGNSIAVAHRSRKNIADPFHPGVAECLRCECWRAFIRSVTNISRRRQPLISEPASIAEPSHQQRRARLGLFGNASEGYTLLGTSAGTVEACRNARRAGAAGGQQRSHRNGRRRE